MTKESKIRKLRIEAGLSQNQLARKANVDRGTVSGAENGGNPTELTLSRLAKALGDLLGRPVDKADLA